MKHLKTQEDIMATWQGDPDKPVVSICCITYNHEPYIEDALEGFLIQETDFPFEILIHDDASTDKTRDTIREYESKYPKLIKPIYQTVNQFSQGKRINAEFNLTRAQGEYIALCEGDDYWLTPDKIQKQIERLQTRDIDICFHPVITEFHNSGIHSANYGYYGDRESNISLEEIFYSGGNAIPACSIVLRMSCLNELKEKYPDFLFNNFTHFYYQVFGSRRRGALYIPDIMGYYRRGHPESWTKKNQQANNFLENNRRSIASLCEFDQITLGFHNKLVNKLISKKVRQVLLKPEIACDTKSAWLIESRQYIGHFRYQLSNILLKLRLLSPSLIFVAKKLKQLKRNQS